MSDPTVLLVAADSELEPGDWQWPPALRSLLDALAGEDVEVRERFTASDGHKGAASEIVLALGGSGAVGAVVTIVLHWLTQRSSRRVQVTVERDGDRSTYDITSTGLGQEAVRDITLAVFGRDPAPADSEPPALESAEE
ncbi:hypothetical protein AB0F81_08010 [Actinoplanes sp. NPDC024001]|uniref:effector-associated constant component EACC1 n=1 Tax=Actinoplanes sp. NPDC024001 TaxID=3154598 RepID=UPI0033D316AD